MIPRSIAHLTSVHQRYDIRIFLKMCRSAVRHGHTVALVVADGLGDERKDGVDIIDAGAGAGKRRRLWRMTFAVNRMMKAARAVNADIYHLHDPELIPLGIKLKKSGKTVVFDSHENTPQQIIHKPYLNKPLRQALATAYQWYEKYGCRRFDAIITATPAIAEKFLRINPRTLAVNNFPLPGELHLSADWENKERQVCYVGGIAPERGIFENVQAMQYVDSDIRLQLAGRFSATESAEKASTLPGWKAVDMLGFLTRNEVRDVLHRCMAGVVTFHPLPNHVEAQPNKMFEYMSAGLPVIASKFPLWQKIVEDNECGLCVDPLNPRAIAEAINTLVNNPDQAKEMGENGQRMVRERYNWKKEEEKLLRLYSELSMQG